MQGRKNIMSAMIEQTAISFNIASGPNFLRTSFLPTTWLNHTCHSQKMSLKSTSYSPADIIQKIMQFLQLGGLHGRIYFGSVNVLPISLLIASFFIVWFVGQIFAIERLNFPMWSLPIARMSKYRPLPPCLAYFNLNVESSLTSRTEWTTLIKHPAFRMANRLQFCQM